MSGDQGQQDRLYIAATDAAGPMLARLCAAYESDPAAREDLAQEVHMQLWRSLARFRQECSLSTWAWRVGHAVCVQHVRKSVTRRGGTRLVPLEEVETRDPAPRPDEQAGERLALERVYALVRALKPADREIMLLYLEAMSADEIAEITGVSPGAVATRVHRIKSLLARQFQTEGQS